MAVGGVGRKIEVKNVEKIERVAPMHY